MKLKIVIFLLFLLPKLVLAEWVLPIPDGGGVKTSKPSIQGKIIEISNNTIKLQKDIPGKVSTIVDHLTYNNQTTFFFYSGGILFPDELSSGQYIWIWYITENPKMAGNPPIAAVIMLWSTNIKDVPANKAKWRFVK